MNRYIQTFAGTELKKQDYGVLYAGIIESVLVELIKQDKNSKKFVTPEQFVVKYRARFGQVNSVLNNLVSRGLLKQSVERQLDNGRVQKYYYFNMSPTDATKFATHYVEMKQKKPVK